MSDRTVSAAADKLLGVALVRGAPACGIDPARCRVLAPGAVELAGTGVSVFWAADAFNGEAGWLIREVQPTGPGLPPSHYVVTRIPEDEAVRAAKAALLTATERRLGVVLNGI